MIHCFSIGGRNMVLDVNSGALHCVDDVTFDVLNACAKHHGDCSVDTGTSPPGIDRTIPVTVQEEINALIKDGLLFSPQKKDEALLHLQTRKPVVKALCLHIAHECNLRCAYCFAGQGNYSESDRGLMPLETGKNALNYLIENSGSRRNLEVDFFGGEPMLNFDVVKQLVSYGRSREKETGKNFRFTLTTNGTLLDEENIKYINENFDNVVISLDGRKHVNDHMRKFTNKSGSYEEIFPKIQALAEARMHKNYYVRGTYTRYNLDFAEDVLHLADLGFKNISVEPVVAPPSADYSIREEDLPVLFSEYEKLTHALLVREKEGRKIFFFHFEMDISGGPCIAKRVTGCGAGSEYLSVTPSGKFYPCHQFVGDEKFISHKFDFANCNVFTKPECSDCWAKFYCSGGCMATAYYATGNINKPDKISCALMKKRIECALYIFAERQENQIE